MTEHTPGPWHIEWAFGEDAYPTIQDGQEKNICFLQGGSFTDESQFIPGDYDWPVEANARLITAAPDLLEALQAVVAGSYEEDDSHEDYLLFECRECIIGARDDVLLISHTDDCSVGKAEAAIAKALGQKEETT